jgi:hypothetical protein
MPVSSHAGRDGELVAQRPLVRFRERQLSEPNRLATSSVTAAAEVNREHAVRRAFARQAECRLFHRDSFRSGRRTRSTNQVTPATTPIFPPVAQICNGCCNTGCRGELNSPQHRLYREATGSTDAVDQKFQILGILKTCAWKWICLGIRNLGLG